MAGEATEGNGVSAGLSREDILASLPDDDAPAEVAADEGSVEASDETDDPDAAATASDEDDTDEDEADVEDDDEDAPSDPETQKRLDAVRRAEKRSRDQLAAERAEIEKLRAEHADDVKALREFTTLKKRRDIVGVARMLGYKDADFEDLSLAFYADSEKGKADPKYKAKVEQTAKERALQDRLDELQKRIDERDEAEKTAKAEAEQQKQITAYVDSVAKAATTKTAPRVASALKEFGDDAKDDLLRIAGKLYRQSGEQPKPSAVVKAYEAYLEKAAKLGGAGAGVGDAGKKPKSAPAAKPATPSGKKLLSKEEILASLPDEN